MRGSYLLIAAGLVFSLIQPAIAKSSVFEQLFNTAEASLLVLDHQGQSVYSIRPDKQRVPASTLKLLTTLLAIEKWGLSHRFYTDFFLLPGNDLGIKGYGDPFLISEELSRITEALSKIGVRTIRDIVIDTHRFPVRTLVPGRGQSRNPYDAPVGALAVNFNTIALRKSGDTVHRGEAQTPVTPSARRLANELKSGKHRINIPTHIEGAVYFAEILAAKMKDQGIMVQRSIRPSPMPKDQKPIYRHHNSKNLKEVLRGMLRYSNNFIANQLFLMLASAENQPVTLKDAQDYTENKAVEIFGWKNFRVLEGAGLSRKNSLSARQLIDILQKLKPYRGLLPSQNPRIRAKSGTLNGVNCYAGFLNRGSGWTPFALLINKPVALTFRYQAAIALLSDSKQ